MTGQDVLLSQKLLQNSRKETSRLSSTPSYRHSGFIFAMLSSDKGNLSHSEMKIVEFLSYNSENSKEHFKVLQI